jgi:hypothetical protein
MNDYFADLGQAVQVRWKAANFSLPAFPGIATALLEECPPIDHVDLAALVRDFLIDDSQPMQSLSGFGQPELVVYDHPRFYIQVLFWLDGTTDIHQHEFSGAFHVLAGSSVHSHFAFENPQAITAHFQVGDLRLIDTRLLETGATVPIVSGRGCIHSLFHLETPSVTVVVRTRSDPGTGPQFTYLPPHIALDPMQDDALTMRRKQLLDALEQVGDPDYPELVQAMISELDFERGFFILQNGMPHLRAHGAWEEVWNVFEQKHGELAGRVVPTLEEIIRRDGLVDLRGSVEDVEHRFFLALLLSVRSRSQILEMVAQRYPGEAQETILRWAGELLVTSPSGTWMIDAEFPDGLSIDPDERPDVLLRALRALLTGGNTSGVTRGEARALRDELARSSWRVLAAS